MPGACGDTNTGNDTEWYNKYKNKGMTTLTAAVTLRLTLVTDLTRLIRQSALLFVCRAAVLS